MIPMVFDFLQITSSGEPSLELALLFFILRSRRFQRDLLFLMSISFAINCLNDKIVYQEWKQLILFARTQISLLFINESAKQIVTK